MCTELGILHWKFRPKHCMHTTFLIELKVHFLSTTQSILYTSGSILLYFSGAINYYYLISFRNYNQFFLCPISNLVPSQNCLHFWFIEKHTQCRRQFSVYFCAMGSIKLCCFTERFSYTNIQYICTICAIKFFIFFRI
jgi:hypothetical protein